MARRRHDALICGCGCGQWAPDAHDPDTDGEWVMVDDDAPVCYAGATIQRWREENPTLEAGALPYVRRLTRAEIRARRGD